MILDIDYLTKQPKVVDAWNGFIFGKRFATKVKRY